MQQLLTADEAAEILRQSKRTILKWARDGRIEREKVSRKSVLFTREAIDLFLIKTKEGDRRTKTDRRISESKPALEVQKGGISRNQRESWRSLRREIAACR